MEQLKGVIDKIDWMLLLSQAGRVVLILILAWVVMALIRSALRRLEQRLMHRAERQGDSAGEASKRVETLSKLLRQGLYIVVWVVVILILLSEFGVAVGPLLASAGIVGLAVGFGAQNLVRDVISGFFIILENQVRVGDVAIVNGTGGLVEGINFRTLVLRDLAGVVHVFPNGTITTLSNMTKGWSAYVFDIGVAYKEDTDRVSELLKQVGAEMRGDDYFGPLIVEDMELFGVNAFGDSAVMLKGRLKTKPIHQWEVGREFLRRVKQRFDAEGVEIPFPHRSIYFGEASKPFITLLQEQGLGQEKAPEAEREKAPQ